MCVLAFTVLSSAVRGADAARPIPGPLAISRLNALQGHHVILVLESMDGSQHVQCARVRPGGTARRVYFDRHLVRIPGHELTVAAEFDENQTRQRKKTDSRWRCQELRLDGSSVTANTRQYVVRSIRAIEFDAPETYSRFLYRAVKLDPASDPWQSTRGGGPSAWVIQYGPPESPARFTFRIPNPAHYPNPRIASVTMHDAPEWVYDRATRTYRSGVVFTVSYIGSGPAPGHFLLDADGYPKGGSFQGGLIRILDAEVLAAIKSLRESAVSHRETVALQDRAGAAGEEYSVSSTPLRYALTPGSHRVVTTHTRQLAGAVSRSAIDVSLTTEEHLRITVAARRDRQMRITVSPQRYVVTTRTSVSGREVGRETYDSSREGRTPASLSPYETQAKPLLGRQFEYSLSPRGLLRPESDPVEESRFQVFRRARCGFIAPLIPLLPSDESGQSWREVSEFSSSRRLDLIWQRLPDTVRNETGLVSLQGEGELRAANSGSVSGKTGGQLTATVLLQSGSLLPVELAYRVEDVREPTGLEITRSRKHLQETVRWTHEDVSNTGDELSERTN
jgi:hypothetical protein